MTLNQIVKRIRTICEAHEQINTFVFGDIDDKLSTEIVYPAAFMPYPSSSISGVDDVLSCQIFFMDKMILGGSTTDNTLNELEVTSDMYLVAKDIFAQFLYQKFDPIWNVNNAATFNLINETDEDYLAGVQMSFNIKSRYLADRCQVPSTYTY